MKRDRHFAGIDSTSTMAAKRQKTTDMAQQKKKKKKKQKNTMATSVKVKDDDKKKKMATAAFAASQPLFDSLRTARDRLPDQGMHLTVAANLVQQLHVGLHLDDGTNDVARHAQYMDATVEAWRCATDTYCDVFAHLAAITAANPDERRAAAVSHASFEKMLDTARKAQQTAAEYTLAREKPDLPIRSPKQMKEAVAEPPSSPHSYFPPSQATPTPAAKKSSLDAKYDHSGLRLLWQNGRLQVPISTLTKAEKKEWNAMQKMAGRVDLNKSMDATVKERNGVQVNGEAAAAKEKKEVNGDTEVEENMDEATAALQAEVEARIKAKEEARLAKKAEKKRKRESGDSFLAAEDAPATDPAAIADRPKKKKAKKSNHDPEEPANSTPATATKRKGSVDAGLVNGDQPTKKQKKHNNNKG